MTTQPDPEPEGIDPEETAPRAGESYEQLWKDILSQAEGVYDRLEALIDEVCRPTLLRYGAPRSEIDRLLQDTLVSVWTFAGKLDAAWENFRGFLKWRARGVLTTFRREQSDTDQHDPIDFALQLPDGGVQQVDVAVMKEISETYNTCRDRLEPKLGDAWRARYDRNLEPSAIAKLLNITASNVGVRLFRARDQIMDCLVEKGVFR
ncbi:MAG: RNA polymerase sigma factor (sigma-70 family) [Planctomycetota bacterium]|jgi:RNA polymerase sigma factor (sigma-70 family)